jgi:hypothetical protein
MTDDHNNDDEMVDTLGINLLRGVAAIAEFLGEDERKVYYLLETRQIPAGKLARMWVASPQKLREHIERVVSGETLPPRPHRNPREAQKKFAAARQDQLRRRGDF